MEATIGFLIGVVAGVVLVVGYLLVANPSHARAAHDDDDNWMYL